MKQQDVHPLLMRIESKNVVSNSGGLSKDNLNFQGKSNSLPTSVPHLFANSSY